MHHAVHVAVVHALQDLKSNLRIFGDKVSVVCQYEIMMILWFLVKRQLQTEIPCKETKDSFKFNYPFNDRLIFLAMA